MKNAFYFTLKALSIIKIFKLLPWLFGHVKKPGLIKDKINFKIYDVTNCLINNYNTHYRPISHEIKTSRQWNFVG